MAFIEFHYGPYSEDGFIKHRTNRLMNLANYLKNKGNSIELIPSIFLDTLEVVIALRVAFRCRITFLSQLNYEVFGIEHDPTLMRAIRSVDEAINRIGHVGPNIKVPGLYNVMFSVSQDFGSGKLHNNDPKMIEELRADEEDDDSIESEEFKKDQKRTHTKNIKFTHF